MNLQYNQQKNSKITRAGSEIDTTILEISRHVVIFFLEFLIYCWSNYRDISRAENHLVTLTRSPANVKNFLQIHQRFLNQALNKRNNLKKCVCLLGQGLKLIIKPIPLFCLFLVASKTIKLSFYWHKLSPKISALVELTSDFKLNN